MRMTTRLAGVLGATAVVSVGFVGVANADRGDGQLACNSGEICFAEHANGVGGQRHFFYNAEHSSAGNFHNGVRFYHNASSLNNRDTECGVWVQESGDVVNDSWLFLRNSGWVNFAYDLNDENARHWRC
ncbi:hypothetical protein ACWCOV_20710 [Kribbella sp. NPDC002412]